MRKKLFTKTIDTQLFKQYPKGNSLEAQKVVAKIFNPYGRGRWYILNSDPQDPDYLWAIVEMNGEIEIGSVSREELETITVRPFGLNLERDLYFSPVNAKEVYDGLRAGEFYKDGGETDLKIVENAEEESFLTVSDAKANSMAVKLANGGSIPNNYSGRTTEDIWNNLTENQRVHFMFDHFSELGIEENEIVMYANKEFKSLNENIQDAFKVHTMMGQYAEGGYMAKGGQVSGYFKFVPYKSEGNFYVNTKLIGLQPEDIMVRGIEGKLKGDDFRSAEYIATVIMQEHEYIDKLDIVKQGATVLKNKTVASFIRDKNDKDRYTIKYEEGGYMARGGEISTSDVRKELQKLGYSEIDSENLVGKYIDKVQDSKSAYAVAKEIDIYQQEYKEKYKYDEGGYMAKGGEVYLPVGKNISGEEIKEFVDYVYKFYGKGGTYADDLNGGFTKTQIKKAVDQYIDELSKSSTWGYGDSLDRERVRMILDPEYSLFKDGGQIKKPISKSTTYVPNRDVKDLTIVLKGELKKIKGKDILDGVYLKKKLARAKKPAAEKKSEAEEILKSCMKKAKITETKVDVNDIESLLSAGFDRKDIEIILLGYGYVEQSKIKCDNEFGSSITGVLSFSDDYQKPTIKSIVEGAKKGYFEIGMKYPTFEWKKIVEKYKINKTPKNITRTTTNKTRTSNYEVFTGKDVAIGHLISYKWEGEELREEGDKIGVLDLSKPTEYQKERDYPAGFNGGYWGIVTKKKEILYDILESLVSQKKGYVKALDVFENGLGGIDYEDVKGKFANGGEIFEDLKKKDMLTKAKIVTVIGFDEAYKYLDREYVVSPYSLIQSAVRKGFITIDEINKDVWESAVEESNDIEERYADSGEGIGSSDMNAFIYSMLNNAGIKVGVVDNKYQRMANGGEVEELEIEFEEEDDDILVEYKIKIDDKELEIFGKLKTYKSGRGEYYQFEPDYFSDADAQKFHDENWEKIEDQIINAYDTKFARGGVIKEDDYYLVLKGMDGIKRFRVMSVDDNEATLYYSTSKSGYTIKKDLEDMRWLIKNGYIKKTNEKEYWKKENENIEKMGEGAMIDRGFVIKPDFNKSDLIKTLIKKDINFRDAIYPYDRDEELTKIAKKYGYKKGENVENSLGEFMFFDLQKVFLNEYGGNTYRSGAKDFFFADGGMIDFPPISERKNKTFYHLIWDDRKGVKDLIFDNKEDAEKKYNSLLDSKEIYVMQLSKDKFSEYGHLQDHKTYMMFPKYVEGGMMTKGGVIPNEINELYNFLKKTYPNTRITINKGKLGNDFMIKVYDDGFFTGYVSELEDKFPSLKIKRVVKKYSKEGHKTDSILVRLQNIMAKGGVTFKEKVKSISESLLKRKKVSPSVQKDYGKTYSKKEALESAKRIAGAMRAKELRMKKK